MVYERRDEWIAGARGRHRGPEFDRGMRGDPRGRRGDPGRGRGRGGHGGPGMGMGRGFAFDFREMFGRRAAVRRGDVRSAILALLAESPMHGYQIMQELNERSGGAWRPSAGSVYPTLQLLEDEGLIRGEDRDGRRVFALTDVGKTAAAKAQEAGAPWELDRNEAGAGLDGLVMQVVRAAMQVRHVGTLAAMSEARRILVQTRKDLYRLLADDEFADETETNRPAPDLADDDAGSASTARSGDSGEPA